MIENIASNINIDEQIEIAVKSGGKYFDKKSGIIDKRVIEAMCRGDHDAFKKVYLHSVGPLTDFLTILLQSKEDAEEAAQDSFTYILENLAKIDHERNFKGYLYSIAKTHALQQMARRRRDAAFVDYAKKTLTEFDLSPDEIVMTNELSLLINMYFSNMPPQRRRVFEMSRNEGKNNKEIAEELNISISTVKMHMRLALKGMHKLMSVAVLFFFFS